MTILEFANAAELSESSARRAVREGLVEHRNHPHGGIRISEQALAAYLESVRVPAKGRTFYYVHDTKRVTHNALLERSRAEAVASLRGGK